MMFAVSPSLGWKSQAPPFSLPFLALKFLFQQLECSVLQLSDTRFHHCLIWGHKNISAQNSSCDTTLDHTCFFHCCINYFTLFSAYRKISRYWHLPHTTMWFSWVLAVPSPNPQLKQLNSSCTTQSSFLRPFHLKVNNNEVGSTTDPRGALKMKQWERNENHANYKWNCRGESKSPAAIFSSFFVYCYCCHNLLQSLASFVVTY